MDLFYWHGMVPLSAYRTWKGQCAGNASNSPTCNALLTQYTNLIGNFDPDNLYTNFFTGACVVVGRRWLCGVVSHGRVVRLGLVAGSLPWAQATQVWA